MNRMVRACGVLLVVLFGAVFVTRAAGAAGAAGPTAGDAPAPGAFPLVDGQTAASVVVDGREAEVVSVAASAFAGDVERVTGRKPAVGEGGGTATAAVFVGTVGDSRVIDGLVAAGKVDVSAIKGKWEAFTIAVADDPAPGVKRGLVVAGSDRRGTAYGVFTLSEAIGVSPWYWWADVPARKRAALYVSVPAGFHDAPGVKYRGIFINDEDWGMNPWASKTFDPAFGNIGPKTYERVFELLLRLRMNYIWPAMHPCSREFASEPENWKLAGRYGIVAGASHCEPMLCNNVHWNEKTQGKWDYTVNRDAIRSYWEDSARTRGGEEAVWGLGIRGIHDAGMEGPRDTRTRTRVLTEVFADQRALVEKYVSKRWGPVAQCFVPYKEVLPIYDAGLKVPEDVTLVWVDDNFGYIRRLSNPEERKRSGGAGVYYHISYYGGPHSYTWVNTTAPGLIWEEMHKAWENEARTLWVLNVGDLKPGEIGIDYFARLAWGPEELGADSQTLFLRQWAGRTFGDKLARPVAELLTEYYRLGTIRKPELMDRAWAVALPAGRAAELKKGYEDVLKRDVEIAAAVPTEWRDAYVETVGFPARVLGMTGLIFMADRDAQRGVDAAGNGKEVARLRGQLESEVENFNTKVAGGKWKRMMPGLVTGKYLTRWSSQVRWPWGEKAGEKLPAEEEERVWRDAAAADRMTGAGAARWVAVAGLGGTGRAVALEPAGLSSAWKVGDAGAPGLEFEFVGKGGDGEAVIDFLPTFRIYPGTKLRVAVSVDGGTPQVVEVPGSSGAEDEKGAVRSNAVRDNYVRARVGLGEAAAGKHVLSIRAVDPGVAIDRVSVP